MHMRVHGEFEEENIWIEPQTLTIFWIFFSTVSLYMVLDRVSIKFKEPCRFFEVNKILSETH